MLHPDTGLPLTLHWCLEETHPYAWEAQKQSHECAAAYVRAAKRAWLNGPSRLPPGEHELPLDWPQFCMSDNGTTALATNTALKMFSARCACHIAYICVRVLLWHGSWKRGTRAPRHVPVDTRLRELVAGFEQLRAWAWALKDQSNRKEWCRLKCGGKQHNRSPI